MVFREDRDVVTLQCVREVRRWASHAAHWDPVESLWRYANPLIRDSRPAPKPGTCDFEAPQVIPMGYQGLRTSVAD